MLNPNQLHIFLVAAETLNFSRAAERLNLSQPSITQHIHLLEAHFNAPLFVRSGRKLTLSPTGVALLPLARQIVSLSLRTDEVMDALRGEVHGELRIVCTTSPGKYLLPVLLANFMRLYPHVHAVCEVYPRAMAMQRLEQGGVHFIFSSAIEKMDRNIELSKFISDPVVLIAPFQHPWAHRGEIAPEELLGSRFILREETSGTYRVVCSGLAQFGINIHNLQNILTVGNSEAIAIAVQQGVGVGFVSSQVYENMVAGKVAKVTVTGLELHQDVFLIRDRLQPYGSLQSAFWEFVLAGGAERNPDSARY